MNIFWRILTFGSLVGDVGDDKLMLPGETEVKFSRRFGRILGGVSIRIGVVSKTANS